LSLATPSLSRKDKEFLTSPSFMGGILAGEQRVPDPIVSLEYEGALKSDGFALLDRGLSIRHEERDALWRE